MSYVMRKPVYGIREQQRCRSACASAQSDQCLYCLLPGKYNTSTCYIRNFKNLASLCNWAGQFKSYPVANSQTQVFSWHDSNEPHHEPNHEPPVFGGCDQARLKPVCTVTEVSKSFTILDISTAGIILSTVWFMVFSTSFSLIPSKRIKPDKQNIQGLLYYLSFFLILPTEKRYWARISENQFLHWKLHAFYSAILTSCSRHDVNNIKEPWNAGD